MPKTNVLPMTNDGETGANFPAVAEMFKQNPLATFYAYDDIDLGTLSHATGYVAALSNFEQYLRSKWKYGHDYKNIQDCLDDLYKQLFEIKGQYHLPE